MQLLEYIGVPDDIAFTFSAPRFAVCFWFRFPKATIVHMKETSMNKYDFATPRKN